MLVLIIASHLTPATCCCFGTVSCPLSCFGIWMELCLFGTDQSCSTSFSDVVHRSVSNLVLASWQSWLPSGLNYGLHVIYITVLHAAPSTIPRLIQSDLRLWPSHSSSHPIGYIEYVSQVPWSNGTNLPWTALLHGSKDRIVAQQNAAVRSEGPVESGLLVHTKSATWI